MTVYFEDLPLFNPDVCNATVPADVCMYCHRACLLLSVAESCAECKAVLSDELSRAACYEFSRYECCSVMSVCGVVMGAVLQCYECCVL